MSEQQPVVVQAVRTPQGKQGGVFADTGSEELSVPLVNAMLERTGLSSEHVDDVRWGCAKPVNEQSNNIARVIALLSELGEDVPGTTINRLCASSAEAISSAADSIRAGQREVIVAGGVENMTRNERRKGIDVYDGIAEQYDVAGLQMGQTAETVAREYDINREEQDAYGARSQQRACAAAKRGKFDDEIVPIDTGKEVVEEDEGLRPGTTKESIADLPPAFEEDGTVTAANASQISDGAAGLLITSRAFAQENGLEIRAEILGHEVAGVDPRVMGIGPVPAVRGLWERNGRSAAEYDLVELNEAFASQTLYCQRELGFDDDVFNVNGGAIAIGHPLGASGSRLPVTLIHELERRGGGLGLSTMCVGYGQGMAVEFRVPGQ
ncbi:thiolase family protein [Natrarchaeobaculum sulfurireducens]|uniref:acetyl-CoA C-acyltransferase n=1 Tax=Natrarchaeobaculum sulfurireducens TaxID=2044521 RepID=A0A346P9R4_9EURY|nr:thiolase family protein [Natrarchaeobaculum sulfurireducens]AXR76259.1 acetyl-CoA acetyltransferase [Natrarchaeobaculum sulfurireducens]AXR79842.1 Acetyl-CoA acetyltransferase [Natrarchaeobaculum sulfurireducens]